MCNTICRGDYMNENKIFGERLKLLRVKKGLTLEDVAKKIGVSKTTVSQWERGKTIPRDERLLPLSLLFDVSPSQLFESKQEQEKVIYLDEAYTLINSVEFSNMNKSDIKKTVQTMLEKQYSRDVEHDILTDEQARLFSIDLINRMKKEHIPFLLLKISEKLKE